MKQFLFPLTASLLLAATAFAQQDPGSNPVPLYENFGIIDTSQPSPQIDALAFANYGTFSVTGTPFLTEFPATLSGLAFTVTPYDFQNVLNFTNTGTMTGDSGFLFDTFLSTNSTRRPANNIVNKNGATITGSSYMLMSSDNIQSQGLLASSALGMIQLKGKNIDLNRGGLLVNALDDFFAGGCIPGGSPFITSSNFIPDIGIFDLNAALGTNTFRVDRLLTDNGDGTVRVVTPRLTLNTASAFVFTNAVSATNWVVDAVFVQHLDPKIATRVRFYPSTSPTNDYKTAAVELRSFETNVVTGALITHQLYLLDKLASETNFVRLTNISVFPETYMPSPYVVSRATPCEFVTAVPGNAQISTNLFFEPGFCITNFPPTNVFNTNICVSSAGNLVTNLNAFYRAQVANSASLLPAVAGATVTNLTGRVEIDADKLDLTRTRIRGEGLVSIKAKHLVGSANAIVDVPNLSYDLGSTNGTLVVTNLTKISVERFGGTITLFSAIWTNQFLVATNSIEPDPMDTNVPPTLTITNNVTNIVEVGYHIFLVNDQLTTTGQGVIVHDFSTHGTNVIVGDAMNVSERLLVDSESFTLTGTINLGQLIPNWSVGVAPNLKYFTNSGQLTLFNSANFGSDRPQPYLNFVNSGVIAAYNFSIRSDNVDNSGLLSADGVNGSISLKARSVKLQGGQFDAGGDIRFEADTLKLRNHTQASRGIYFSVTNNLSDSGEGSNNTLTCVDGFHLLIKPAGGDLLGTTLRCTAPRFLNAVSTWSAEDRGATPAGYTNNAAVGHLTLDGGTLSLQTLSGTGAKNAIYVDFLELQGVVLADFNANLEIDDNLVVYFADSNVPVEQLDGQFDGRLRWVKDFAGPNSSVDVVGANGQTVKMNRALRESTSIDSDGDGIVNKYDLSPLGGTAMTSVTIVNSPVPTALVSWEGKAGLAYEVEYATSLSPGNWQLLMRYTNTATVNGTITIKDPVRLGEAQRFYRVRYTPN